MVLMKAKYLLMGIYLCTRSVKQGHSVVAVIPVDVLEVVVVVVVEVVVVVALVVVVVVVVVMVVVDL